MRRWYWPLMVLVSAIIAAIYVRWDRIKVVVVPHLPQAVRLPPPPQPERPAKLELTPIPDDPALDAKLPMPCPLTAVEYRFRNLMTNLLVERFDDNSTSRKVVIGRRRIQINTDGAANSYHSRAIKADDETVGAINIICNARVKIFKKVGDIKTQVPCLKGDFSVTDEYVTAYEELRNNNWDETPSGYSIQFDWDIIGRGAQIRTDGPYAPCIKPDGFFVAKTRLRLRSSTDDCDPSIYPDSNTTSSFVLPLNWFDGYQKKTDTSPDRFANFKSGDVVVAYRPGGVVRQPVWAYGVVGDAGPFATLGEATIAFNRQILRSTAAIKTHKQALKLDTDVLRIKEIGFAVFEGSVAELNRDYSAANVKKVGEKRLAAWIDGALDKAKSRFAACEKKLELLPPPQPPPPS
jgi:hypothetical protein